MLPFVRPLPASVPREQPAPVHQHLHRAREGGPPEQPRQRQRQRVRRSDFEPHAAADRVVRARVGVEAAGDHPDEERGRGRVVQKPHGGAGHELRPEADPPGVQPAEQRSAQRLGERHPEPGGADDRDGLEHRRGARAEAGPGPAPLRDARQCHATGERDPEAAARCRACREEGHDGDVRRPRLRRSGAGRGRGGRHARDRSGSGLAAPCQASAFGGLVWDSRGGSASGPWV